MEAANPLGKSPKVAMVLYIKSSDYQDSRLLYRKPAENDV